MYQLLARCYDVLNNVRINASVPSIESGHAGSRSARLKHPEAGQPAGQVGHEVKDYHVVLVVASRREINAPAAPARPAS